MLLLLLFIPGVVIVVVAVAVCVVLGLDRRKIVHAPLNSESISRFITCCSDPLDS